MERWISKVCTRKRKSLNILECFDKCNEPITIVGWIIMAEVSSLQSLSMECHCSA